MLAGEGWLGLCGDRWREDEGRGRGQGDRLGREPALRSESREKERQRQGQTESEKHKVRQKERDQDGVTEEPAGRDPDSDRKGASPLQTLAGDGDEAEGHTCCPNASQPCCPPSPGHTGQQMAAGGAGGTPKDQGSTPCPATNRVCDCRQVPLRPLVPGLGRPLGKSGQVTVAVQASGVAGVPGEKSRAHSTPASSPGPGSSRFHRPLKDGWMHEPRLQRAFPAARRM